MTEININNRSTATLSTSRSMDVLPFIMCALLVVVAILSVLAISQTLQLLVFFVVLVFFVFFFILDLSLFSNRDISFYLLIPLLFSAFQNTYLGLVAPAASPAQIKVMIIANVIFTLAIVFFLSIMNPKVLLERLPLATVLIGFSLVLYGAFLYIIFAGDTISVLSSLRNIEAPVLFFLLGLLAAKRTSTKRLCFYIALLGWCVIAFGFFEKFIFNDIWHFLNIAELWPKKGIAVHPDSGIPYNFYSSEKIGGIQLRRMASSYADPVNFGTVLFLVFSVAWFSRRKWLLLASIIAIILAVSKGALLGVMVFAVTWAFYNVRRGVFLLISCITLGMGVLFIIYSVKYSTLSILAHIYGFFASIQELPNHPLGRGLGNVGTLAGLFSEGQNTAIKESGLGMIIGQLGVMGLFLYLLFFYKISRKIIQFHEKQSKVFAFTLLFAIAFNAVFNEVALSPNSSAGYFILLGLLCANQSLSSKQHFVR